MSRELLQRGGEQRTFTASCGHADGDRLTQVIRRHLASEYDAFRPLDEHARREVPEGERDDAPAVDVGRVAEESGAGIRYGRERSHAAASLPEPGLPRLP